MPGTGSYTYLIIQKVFWWSAPLVIFFFCSVASTWSQMVTDLHQSLRLLDNPAGQSRHRERRGGKASGGLIRVLPPRFEIRRLKSRIGPKAGSSLVFRSWQLSELGKKLGWTVLRSPRRGSELLPAPAPRHQSSLRLFQHNYKFKFKVFAVKKGKGPSCQRSMQAWTLKKINLNPSDPITHFVSNQVILDPSELGGVVLLTFWPLIRVAMTARQRQKMLPKE